jgi:hypothetical protein
MKRRIGVDFDGTLAFYEGFVGPDVLGDPIPVMVSRVKRWLAEGDDVVILTARVHPGHGDDAKIAETAIRKWCLEHLGKELEVTCMNDWEMDEIWDDRAIRVCKNTGLISDQKDVMDMEPEADGIGEFLVSF